MGLIGAVRALLSILTAIPVKAAVNDVYSLSRMVWLFPVAGAVHGVVVAMLLAARQAIGDLTAAVAAATAAHAMNRFMHADGLADFCDGLCAGSRIRCRGDGQGFHGCLRSHGQASPQWHGESLRWRRPCAELRSLRSDRPGTMAAPTVGMG